MQLKLTDLNLKLSAKVTLSTCLKSVYKHLIYNKFILHKDVNYDFIFNTVLASVKGYILKQNKY